MPQRRRKEEMGGAFFSRWRPAIRLLVARKRRKKWMINAAKNRSKGEEPH